MKKLLLILALLMPVAGVAYERPRVTIIIEPSSVIWIHGHPYHRYDRDRLFMTRDGWGRPVYFRDYRYYRQPIIHHHRIEPFPPRRRYHSR